MNESLFNDASATNLHVDTSPISTCTCPWIQTSLTCASVQVVICHPCGRLSWLPVSFLLHVKHTLYRIVIYCTQTKCSCTPCPKKYTPWLLTVSCYNLSAVLLINPPNTAQRSEGWALRDAIVTRSHRRRGAGSAHEHRPGIEVRHEPVEGLICHFKHMLKTADHDFRIYAIECSQLVESNEDGWLESIESRIDIVSYFEKRRLGRMMSAIGRLHGVEAWWRQDVRDWHPGSRCG